MVLFFTYNNGIPAANNNPSVDQPNMQTNTDSIDSIINVDHYSFETNFDGTHKQVQLKNSAGINGAIPAGLQGVGFETLYSSATAGTGELWFVRGASATGVQLTGPGTPSTATQGYTFLPGGILIQWGRRSANMPSGSSIGSEVFPVAFLNGSLTVTGNPLMNYNPVGSRPSSQASLNIRASSLGSTTGFDWQFYTNSSDYKGFTWIAIGY